MIIPVILSGGSGSRLWPLSREQHPKQLLSLAGDKSMLQETLLRLKQLDDCGNAIVVCNEVHRFMVAEQLRQIACTATIILEPEGRNTAPALACAAFQALQEHADPFLLVLPADHVVTDLQALATGIRIGMASVEKGALLTFGIVPTKAETGYGYIKCGRRITLENIDGPAELSVFAVDRFVEKPDLITATQFLKDGHYYWNSGMFLFRATQFLEELRCNHPHIVSACTEAVNKGTKDLDFFRLDPVAFTGCPSESIDYGVMEKTTCAALVPLNAGWCDVGSWSALWEIGQKDQNGNVISGDVLAPDTINSFLYSSSRLLAAIGLEGFVVVETSDAVLIAPKELVQEVKDIVNILKKRNRSEIILHKKVNRPWGTYECIDMAKRYQVKRITVKPGAELSLQMHHHRAEHWVVVKGTAKITNGDKVLMLMEDQSTYIPLGQKHRLENPGIIPLELIEVQSGSYLGEDDIVRFEDMYGR